MRNHEVDRQEQYGINEYSQDSENFVDEAFNHKPRYSELCESQCRSQIDDRKHDRLRHATNNSTFASLCEEQSVENGLQQKDDRYEQPHGQRLPSRHNLRKSLE